MLIELVQIRPAKPIDPSEEYDESLHDINAIIMDMCIALGDTRAFEFLVSGFGDNRWPVDVATDLATVLRQLPAALEACEKAAPFVIDLFEQGVERRLEFAPRGDWYEVRCSSSTDWMPEPEVEKMETVALISMLARLRSTFCHVCEKLFPATSAHDWFQKYAHNESPTPLRPARRPLS